MHSVKKTFQIVVIFMFIVGFSVISQEALIMAQTDKINTDEESIQLIMRADDMGFSNAANLACIKGYKEGIITTVEVLVPGPWFLAAAKLLKENPDLDVGVHLALTSEWDNYKWRPLTQAPSLVTEDRYFPGSDDEFRQLNVSTEEVEQEFRAQIELALKYIPQVSHLSVHMNAPVSTEELIQIIVKLSQEYNLPLGPGMDRYLGMWGVPAEQKEDYLADTLNKLEPGLWVFVCHPALNNPETQAIEGSEYDANIRMAIHREVVTNAVTSDRIKQIVQDRHIKLIRYSDIN
jgi:predicted glycoside hydrolase/deacetylase ChbG (UPF0249 family)